MPPASAPRLLFVPVSAATGSGEYTRCLMLADAARARWPEAAIHFLLSAQAPYAASAPYPKTLFPGSATLHDTLGQQAIERFKPDIAVFDNSGRRGQLLAARAVGARVVYLSSRPRPRAKAFRLRRLRLIDELWFPYPQFIAGGLTPVEALKLRLLRRPQIRYLDYLLPQPDPTAAAATLARLALSSGRYVLVIGGGGGGHPGAEQAPAVYAAVATALAHAGHSVVVLGAPAPADAPPSIRWPGRLTPAEVAALLPGAELIVTNGGAALVQALGCGRPVLAAPVAADQALRIERGARLGALAAAPLVARRLTEAALGLLAAPAARAELAAGAARLKLSNGLATALAAFTGLLAR